MRLSLSPFSSFPSATKSIIMQKTNPLFKHLSQGKLPTEIFPNLLQSASVKVLTL